MRILFTTFPQATHYDVMVPIAWALRTAGHEVRIASQPKLSERITQSGLTAVPVGSNHRYYEKLKELMASAPQGQPRQNYDLQDMGRNEPKQLTWETAASMYGFMVPYTFSMVNEPMIGEVVEFACEWKPDLVLWEPLSHVGAVAARASGAAHARVLWGQDYFGRMHQRFTELKLLRSESEQHDPLRDWLGRMGAEFGVEFGEDLIFGQWTVDPMPPSVSYGLDLPTVPMRYVPYNGVSVVPDWLRRAPERRRVCVTAGLAAMETRQKVGVPFSDLLEQLGDLDIEVVATLPAERQEELGSVPGNVRLVDFVPLDVLLPTCSAIVHHGGAGTGACALLHGVPQVVTGNVFSEVPFGETMHEIGAGAYVDVEEMGVQAVHDALARVLDEPGYGKAANVVREEMAEMPPPNVVVPELLRLAGQHRP
jgi:glycosyltransferase (activator-dependent family)